MITMRGNHSDHIIGSSKKRCQCSEHPKGPVRWQAMKCALSNYILGNWETIYDYVIAEWSLLLFQTPS